MDNIFFFITVCVVVSHFFPFSLLLSEKEKLHLCKIEKKSLKALAQILLMLSVGIYSYKQGKPDKCDVLNGRVTLEIFM